MRKDGGLARERVAFRKVESGDGCGLVGEVPDVRVAGRQLDDLLGILEGLQGGGVGLAGEPHTLQLPRESAVVDALATAISQDP